MTAQTTDVYSGNLRPEESDEIDIRRYIIALFRWWREIVTITLLVGLATGAILYWQAQEKTPVYAASADILIERLLSNIELDPRVSTTIVSNQNDSMGWRASLLQLTKSNAVANAVVEELQTDLPTSLREPERLLRAIDAQIPLSADERPASNLIRITATTVDPDLSAQIANVWARHVVDFINGLYGEVPQTTIDSVTAERDNALAAYQAAEKEYEQYVANNEIDSLSRQIDQKSTLRGEIMANYTRMLTAVVSSEYNTRVGIYTTLATTPINHAMAVIQLQSQGTLGAYTSLYAERAKVMSQLHQARSMRENLLAGGEAAAKSNVMALQLLKVATFATAQDVSGRAAPALTSVSLATTEMTLEEQLADVEALVAVLEEHVARLDAEVQELAATGIVGAEFESIAGIAPMLDPDADSVQSITNQKVAEAYEELMGPDGLLNQAPIDLDSTVSDAHEQVLATLERDIRALRAAISAEQARERELVHRRDLAWKTYDTVGNKLAELNLMRSAANSEVRLGNPAIAPLSPVPASSIVLPLLAAVLLTFLGAVILALIADSLGVHPLFVRRTA